MRRRRSRAHAGDEFDADTAVVQLSAIESAVRADQSAHIALVGIDAAPWRRVDVEELARGGEASITDVALDRLELAMAPGASHQWLLLAHVAFGGERPVDLLARGDHQRVLAQIEAETGSA